MRKKDIINFIELVFKTENKKIEVLNVRFNNDEYENQQTECAIDIITNTKKEKIGFMLHLNKKTFTNKKNYVWCLAILLHEIGHFVTSKGKSSALNEYYAHMWAYRKATELMLSPVIKELKDSLIDWKNASWKDERIYREAYDIAVKEKFI